MFFAKRLFPGELPLKFAIFGKKPLKNWTKAKISGIFTTGIFAKTAVSQACSHEIVIHCSLAQDRNQVPDMVQWWLSTSLTHPKSDQLQCVVVWWPRHWCCMCGEGITDHFICRKSPCLLWINTITFFELQRSIFVAEEYNSCLWPKATRITISRVLLKTRT